MATESLAETGIGDSGLYLSQGGWFYKTVMYPVISYPLSGLGTSKTEVYLLETLVLANT